MKNEGPFLLTVTTWLVGMCRAHCLIPALSVALKRASVQRCHCKGSAIALDAVVER